MARAPVSKTGGWGFESLHSCHLGYGLAERPTGQAERLMAKINPGEFAQQVRQEFHKITWPTRKETTVTTAMVFVMVVLAALFFLLADTIMGTAVRFVLGY